MAEIITPGRGRGKEYNFDVGTKDFSSLIKQGKRLGNGYALAGSIVFALLDTAWILINTYWITPIDAGPVTDEFGWLLLYILLTTTIGFALALLPAWLGGALLASVLHQELYKQTFWRVKPLIAGLIVGGLAGFVACLPILAIQYFIIQPTGHGNFDVFIDRTILVAITASVLGGLTGRKLSRLSQVIA